MLFENHHRNKLTTKNVSRISYKENDLVIDNIPSRKITLRQTNLLPQQASKPSIGYLWDMEGESRWYLKKQVGREKGL